MSNPLLIPFTETGSNRTVFINPNHVIMVFNLQDGQHAGNTVINVTGNSILTETDQLEVVGLINGAMNG